MVSQILVLGTTKMDFTTEKGDKIKGTRVHYLIPTETENENVRGYAPNKAWIEPEAAKNLKDVPGIYDAGFQIVPGPKNPELKLRSVSLISPVNLDFSSPVSSKQDKG